MLVSVISTCWYGTETRHLGLSARNGGSTGASVIVLVTVSGENRSYQKSSVQCHLIQSVQNNINIFPIHIWHHMPCWYEYFKLLNLQAIFYFKWDSTSCFVNIQQAHGQRLFNYVLAVVTTLAWVVKDNISDEIQNDIVLKNRMV